MTQLRLRRTPVSWHRRALLGGIALALALLWLGLCIRFIVHPRVDPVERVDAMYVIGPVDTRWTGAMARADEGVAPVVLATQMIDPLGTGILPTECDEDRYDEDRNVEQRNGYVVACVMPNLYTTRGEARVLAEQVRVNGWEHVAVFTSTPHAARTRMLMERCVPAQVSVWDYPRRRTVVDWFGEFLYQSGAWVKAQIVRSC